MSQVSPSSIHPFFYEECKQVFQQELEYILLTRYLFDRTVKSKEHGEQIISEMNEGTTNYMENFCLKSKVVNINSRDRLCRIGKGKTNNPDNIDIKLVLTTDEIFDILAEIHMSKPQLLGQKYLKEVSNIYIENPLLHLFLKSCRNCNLSKRHIWLSLSEHFSVGEIGLISVVPEDQEFKHIFIYVERSTNYVLLRPLKNKSFIEVALELLNIFCDFGVPMYLNCIQHRYFNKVLDSLKLLELPWTLPTIKLDTQVHKLEKVTLRARGLLKGWMKNSECKNWIIGAHIVQWILNSNKVVDTYIRSNVVNGIIHSPYHALFGMSPHTELVHLNASNDNKKKHELKSPLLSNNMVLLNCSLCKRAIYKVYLCHYCRAACHITCCKRLYLNQSGVRVIVNKCNSCAAFEDKIKNTEKETSRGKYPKAV